MQDDYLTCMEGQEVQIVYRLFLVNYYVLPLHGNIKSETEADRNRSIYYLHGRFSDSLKGLSSTYRWLEITYVSFIFP